MPPALILSQDQTLHCFLLSLISFCFKITFRIVILEIILLFFSGLFLLIQNWIDLDKLYSVFKDYTSTPIGVEHLNYNTIIHLFQTFFDFLLGFLLQLTYFLLEKHLLKVLYEVFKISENT
jgi:hypothetical protein